MTSKNRTWIATFACLPLFLALVAGCGPGDKANEAQRAVYRTQVSESSGLHMPFTVSSRIAVLEEGWDYPCSDCHDDQAPDPTIRELEDEHEFIPADHGGGRFWCTACHYSDDKEYLVDAKGGPVHYDESYKVCGQCHFQKERDFYLGTHGKRIGSWMGERELTACVECHDPHAPAIQARKPLPPPAVRKGLTLDEKDGHAHPSPWEQIFDRRMGTYGEAFFQEREP